MSDTSTAPDRAPLSVVVPTRDRPDHLDACLDALVAELRPGDEVVVVDSASSRGDTADVAARHGVRLVRARVPGASLARNLGWHAASHPLIAFVDDDVRVRPGWADALVGAAAEHPGAAFVTGATHVPSDQAGVEHAVAVKTDRAPAPVTAVTQGTLGGSCNLLVRRPALEAVGGFDESLGPGTWFASAEDLDLYDRLFATGRVGHYTPDAAVDHVQWRTRGQLLRLDWAYGKGMGARIARLGRRDRSRARVIARDALWDRGVVALVRELRRGYRFGVLTVAVRTLATCVGFAADRLAKVAR